MNKRILTALLTVIACLGLLAGCSSPEKTIKKIKGISDSVRSEEQWIQLAEAYEQLEEEYEAKHALMDAALYLPDSKKLQEMLNKYLWAAPVPDKAPGSYNGRVRLKFSGSGYEHGMVYITVDRDEPYSELREDKSVRDDGLTIKECASEWDATVDLYTPGQHTVRAYVVGIDNYIQSKVFEGTYTLTGASFSDFGPSQSPGEYKAPLRLSFNGTDGGKVSYSLDGTDPLWLSVGGPNLSGGGSDSVIEMTEDALTLSAGTVTITARCITDSGLVSPLITATYEITSSFDSASMQVDEDSYYDYICNNWSGVVRYDRATDKYKTILNVKTTSLAVFSGTMKEIDLVDSSSMSALPPQYVVEASDRDVNVSYIYAQSSIDDTYRVRAENGVIGEWSVVARHGDAGSNDEIERVGTYWYRYYDAADRYYSAYQGAFWNAFTKDVPRQGTEDLAKTVDLILDDTAYYTKGYSVMACDLDGEHKRELWSEEASRYQPILDAVTDKVILYHRNSEDGVVHLVYNLATGERYVNPYLSTGENLLGYTSSAAYTDVAGSIYRTPIDYSTLETGIPIKEELETPVEDPDEETGSEAAASR